MAKNKAVGKHFEAFLNDYFKDKNLAVNQVESLRFAFYVGAAAHGTALMELSEKFGGDEELAANNIDGITIEIAKELVRLGEKHGKPFNLGSENERN